MISIYDVGKLFTLLYRSHKDDGRHFQRRYGLLRQRMHECGLNRSLNAITILQGYGTSHQKLTINELKGIAKHCQGMDIPLQDEVKEREVLLLPQGKVTSRLAFFRKLPVLLYDQSSLIDEVETCIHSGSYRSAIVVTWNITYDYIRQWVFKRKRKKGQLNTALAAKGKPRLVNYSDFFKPVKKAPSEREFLEICAGPILGTRVTDPLKLLLNDRNEYAHATFQDPTLNEANHFVERCVKVLNTTPFT